MRFLTMIRNFYAIVRHPMETLDLLFFGESDL